MPAHTDPGFKPASASAGFNSHGPGFVPPGVKELQGFLPHLEILSFIGHGGMGTYYQGRQAQIDRLVAIKILPVEAGADASLIAGFKREARAMASLSHPNVIGIYDFGETASFLYLVMEYVEGDILERLVASRQFDLLQIAGIMTQVCEALNFAHKRGVIHRDIRPGNTMLNINGQVKVGDFGLARLIGDELFQRNLTADNLAMGTLDYVAPEQLEPGRPVDHRADIYSVGMMLYKLLTRTLPRGTFTPPSAIVPGLDPRLDDLVIRCLQRNPEHRYQDITEFWAEIHAQVHAGPPPAAEVPRSPRIRFPGQ